MQASRICGNKEKHMSDELDPTPSSQDNNTQPLEQVDPSAAVASFMEWLQVRETASGPFSVHYNTEAGNALVKQFCDAQGWTLEETQVEQVKTLREKYPE
jgi:hypothetical protein